VEGALEAPWRVLPKCDIKLVRPPRAKTDEQAGERMSSLIEMHTSRGRKED